MWKQSVLCFVRWKQGNSFFLPWQREFRSPYMEALTRLVTESLVRHGFDRPPDYRRLQWSRWFRCESLHSLLYVPSKPGVFALAEEVADFSSHVAADALVRPAGTTATHVATAASAVLRSEA